MTFFRKQLNYCIVVIYAVSLFLITSCENPFVIDITNLYTVHFETNCPSEIDSYRTNKIERIKQLQKDDAEFVGWYTNVSFSGNPISFPYEVTENTTLYAKWDQKYTVTFQTNGGTEIASYKTATITEIPDTTRNGYYFAGWYEAQDFGGEAISFPYHISQPTTLYAKWLRIYTVSFETNGGTEVNPIQAAVITDSPVTRKDGNIFIGWYKEEALANQITFPYTVNYDTTLYAGWVDISNSIYKVEHYQQNTNLTSYTLKDSEIKPGIANNQTVAQPKNYTGFTAKSFTQKTITEDNSTVIKIYYDRNPFTVTFNANGGSGEMAIQTFYYEVQQRLTINIYTRQGYTFRGWSTTSNGNVEISDGAGYSATENKILYAVWEENILNITSNNINSLNLTNINHEMTLRITGDINNNFLSILANKIRAASGDIYLDLSQATGMTEIEGIVTPRPGQEVFKDYSSLFENCEHLKSIVLPNCLKILGVATFYRCEYIVSITLPEGLTTIEEYAFHGCSSLTNLTIPNSVTSIGYSTFSSCYSLERVVLPNIEIIEMDLFQDCFSLKTITIPVSVKKIRKGVFGVFYNCKNLESVVFEDTSNWYVTDKYTYTDGFKISVTNSTSNVYYLTDAYKDRYWYKE